MTISNNPLHLCLETHAVWPSFYTLLLPDHVGTLATVDKLAREFISQLREKQHGMILYAIFHNRLTLCRENSNLFATLEKNIAHTFFCDQLIDVSSQDEQTALWTECVERDHPLSDALVKARAPCTAENWATVLNNLKVNVAKALLKYRAEQFEQKSTYINQIDVWAHDSSYKTATLPMISCLVDGGAPLIKKLPFYTQGLLLGACFEDQVLREKIFALTEKTCRTAILGGTCVRICQRIGLQTTTLPTLKTLLASPDASQISSSAFGRSLSVLSFPSSVHYSPAPLVLLLGFCRTHNLLKGALANMNLIHANAVEVLFSMPEVTQIEPISIATGLVNSLRKGDSELHTLIRTRCQELGLLAKSWGCALRLWYTVLPDDVRRILECDDAHLITPDDFSRALRETPCNRARIFAYCKEKKLLAPVFLQSLLHLRLWTAAFILYNWARSAFREKFDVKAPLL